MIPVSTLKRSSASGSLRDLSMAGNPEGRGEYPASVADARTARNTPIAAEAALPNKPRNTDRDGVAAGKKPVAGQPRSTVIKRYVSPAPGPAGSGSSSGVSFTSSQQRSWDAYMALPTNAVEPMKTGGWSASEPNISKPTTVLVDLRGLHSMDWNNSRPDLSDPERSSADSDKTASYRFKPDRTPPPWDSQDTVEDEMGMRKGLGAAERRPIGASAYAREAVEMMFSSEKGNIPPINYRTQPD